MLDNGVIFDARIAEKYSVEEAIVINKLFGWIKHNATNGKNFKEGRYWTFNSISAFKKYFPFWNESKIKRILIDLAGCTEKSESKPKHEPIIIKGNFNKSSFDRTIWYSFTDDFFAYLVKLGYDLNADFPQAENGYSADGQMDIPQAEEQYQLFNQENNKIEEKENIQKKDDICTEIVVFFNENTDKDSFPRTSKVSEKIKSAINARIKEGYTVQDIKNAILLMNTLGDFYKGKGGSTWKATLLWLLKDTNGNFAKILDGGLHCTPLQQSQYNEVMHNNTEDGRNEYRPATGGYINFRTSVGMYWTHINPEFGQIIDGYKDNDRPDGAELGSPFGIFKWSSTENKWKYDRKS